MSGSRPSWAALGFDLVSLRVLVATIEEKSLTAAALREGLAVSAVSRRISELEGRTGLSLLERHERGVIPTRAGAKLVEQFYRIFALFDAAAVDIENLRGGHTGHVRVAANMTALSSGLVQAVASFLALNPGIDVEIEECTSAEAKHAVETCMADLALISGTLPPETLSTAPWRDDELVVLLPEAHALAVQESLRFQDLLSEPFIGMQRDSALQQLYRHHADVLGGKLRERAHATSFDSVGRMIAAGLGIAILPRSAASLHAPLGHIEIRTLEEPWARRSIMLCTRGSETPAPATGKLVQHLLRDPVGKPVCRNNNRLAVTAGD